MTISDRDALEILNKNGVDLSPQDINTVAQKYGIKELSVFGSCIRADFNESSDIDFLIEFLNNSEISLFDLMDIQEYFEKLIHRKVDLVEPEGIVNPERKKEIINSKVVIYAA